MADFGSEQRRPPENDMAQRRQVQRVHIFSDMPKPAARLIEGQRYEAGLIPHDRPHLYADYDPVNGDRLSPDINAYIQKDAYRALAGEGTPNLYYRNPYPDLLGLATTASGSAELANSFGFLSFSPYYALINRGSRSGVEHHQADFLKTVKGNPQPSAEAAELAHTIARRMREVKAAKAPDDRRSELVTIYNEFFNPQSVDFQKNAPYLAEAYLYMALNPHQDSNVRQEMINHGSILRFGRNGSDAPLQIFAPNVSYWDRVDASWVDAKIGEKKKTWQEQQQEEAEEARRGFPGWNTGGGRQSGQNSQGPEGRQEYGKPPEKKQE